MRIIEKKSPQIYHTDSQESRKGSVIINTKTKTKTKTMKKINKTTLKKLHALDACRRNNLPEREREC